jgi:SPP1 gp7 family putative phage head morphogenesis protein
MAASPADRPAPEAIGVKFQEAIEFLRRKLNITSAEWRAIWTEAGAISDAAADQVKDSMFRDILQAVLDQLETGGTLQDFRAAYDRITAEAGWSSDGHPGWHSQLVWRLHTQTAYSAGRWEQAQELKAATPSEQLYGRYITVGDHRVRPTHAAWQGIILPLEHPFWLTHWTPNGFNCRCHVMVVTDRTIKRYGWTVTPDNDPRLSIPPDPGWSGNVGIAGTRLRQIEAAKSKALA